MTAPPRYRVVALERGLKVLATFAPGKPPMGASEIARAAGIPVATAYRLLQTLAASGYVEQSPDGRYLPGRAVLTLGFAALRSDDLVEAAQEPLRKLAETTKETTNLGVRLGDRLLYLVRFRTEHLWITNLHPGSTLPLGRTSMGKLLLAFTEPEDAERLERFLPDHVGGEAVGPHALEAPDALRTELAEIRARGWSMQNEELAPNLRSVAVAVRSPEGQLAAINIAVDAQRWSPEALVEELLPELRRTAFEISLRTGYLDAVE